MVREITAFLDMIAAERGAAGNTLDAYRRDLTDYCAFLEARKMSLAEAQSAIIREYLSNLELRGFKPA